MSPRRARVPYWVWFCWRVLLYVFSKSIVKHTVQIIVTLGTDQEKTKYHWHHYAETVCQSQFRFNQITHELEKSICEWLRVDRKISPKHGAKIENKPWTIYKGSGFLVCQDENQAEINSVLKVGHFLSGKCLSTFRTSHWNQTWLKPLSNPLQ